jgi:hypothetical protein
MLKIFDFRIGGKPKESKKFWPGGIVYHRSPHQLSDNQRLIDLDCCWPWLAGGGCKTDLCPWLWLAGVKAVAFRVPHRACLKTFRA